MCACPSLRKATSVAAHLVQSVKLVMAVSVWAAILHRKATFLTTLRALKQRWPGIPQRTPLKAISVSPMAHPALCGSQRIYTSLGRTTTHSGWRRISEARLAFSISIPSHLPKPGRLYKDTRPHHGSSWAEAADRPILSEAAV